MIDDLIRESKQRMQGALDVLEDDLIAIRTGRASPALVEKLQVEYYGSNLSLIQLATISVPESGFTRVATAEMKVVLPAPLGPSRAVRQPLWATRSMPSMAVVSP